MDIVYNIRNFRTFGEDGTDIPFAPITFLTGANCSGKSSVVKSLVLFERYLREVLEESRITGSLLPFNHFPNFTDTVLKLGGYQSVYSTKSRKNQSIVSSYQVFSRYLGQQVKVEYHFVKAPSDDLDNGLLGSLCIKDQDGKILLRWTQDEKYPLSFNRLDAVDLTSLKARFINFAAWKLNSKMYIEKPSWIAGDADRIRLKIRDILSHIDTEHFKIYKSKTYASASESIVRLRSAESSILTEIISCETLFPMPVLEITRNMSKNEAVGHIQEKIASAGINERNMSEIQSVIKDFKKSGYETLAEYFAAWEEENVLKRTHLESFDNTRDFCKEAIHALSLTKRYGIARNRNIYNALLIISMVMDADFASRIEGRDDPNECLHESYGLFLHFMNLFLNEVLIPSFAGNIKYLGTSKIDAKRVYFPDDRNNDFGEMFIEYFNLKKKWAISMMNATSEYVPGDFMNKWIKRFGLGDRLEIKTFGSGQGISVYLDDRILADEGFGVTQILAILLNIEIAIIHTLIRCQEGKMIEDEQLTLILEEPEVHLHPKYQSLLADLFHDAYSVHGINFIIETHSEYLIRRSQVIVSQMGFDSHEEADSRCGFRTIYVPKSGKPYNLFYRSDGKFAEDFGPGFFDESSNLIFDIM